MELKLRAYASIGIKPVPRPKVKRPRTAPPPSKRAGPSIVVLEPGKPERRVALDKPLVIGRALECEVAIGDDDASRRHAQLTPLADGSLEVLDLGSKNGVWSDKTRFDRRALRPGDSFRIGATICRFEK